MIDSKQTHLCRNVDICSNFDQEPGIVTGATGAISKTFRKYVSNIPGNHEVKELQKTAILGTAHILRKVLM